MLDNPPPKTNEFFVMVRYNLMIDNLVNESLLKEIEFQEILERTLFSKRKLYIIGSSFSKEIFRKGGKLNDFI